MLRKASTGVNRVSESKHILHTTKTSPLAISRVILPIALLALLLEAGQLVR